MSMLPALLGARGGRRGGGKRDCLAWFFPWFYGCRFREGTITLGRLLAFQLLNALSECLHLQVDRAQRLRMASRARLSGRRPFVKLGEQLRFHLGDVALRRECREPFTDPGFHRFEVL